MDSTLIVGTLNDAWRKIQLRNPEVPNVVLVTGRRRHKSEGSIRGQHCSDTWHAEGFDVRLAEVWITGELLAGGGQGVLQTLLHEAAHALAGARKLKDTSNKNRYHNKVFVKIAEELGLKRPESSGGPARGYSNCTITNETSTLYASVIESLDDACKSFVAPSLTEEEKTRKPSVKAYCDCEDDNYVTWTKKLAKRYTELGIYPLECAVCKQPFVPEDEEN